MKKGKSAEVDNIPAELVQAGGENVITPFTAICDRIWQTGEWPTPWTQSILKRLKPQAEKIIAEEQARFRAGRSTTEQIFNLRILCEEYLQHQQDLYHVFIDFKKAFDRVWHAALWATRRSTTSAQTSSKSSKTLSLIHI